MFVQLRTLQSESGLRFLPFSESLMLRELALGPRCDVQIETIRQLASDEAAVFKAQLSTRGFRIFWIIGEAGTAPWNGHHFG